MTSFRVISPRRRSRRRRTASAPRRRRRNSHNNAGAALSAPAPPPQNIGADVPVLHRDFETRSTLDLSETGAWRYAAEPNTGVWCVAYAVDDGPVQLWIPGQPIPEEFHIAANDPTWL